MINIAILTSEENELTERIIQYYSNIPDAQISCVISNIENNEQKKLRRYKLDTRNTGRYKEIDKILTETDSHYIIASRYNEVIPKNFCKKYDWKIFNLKKTKNGIEMFYEKADRNKTIFLKDIITKEEISQSELLDKINDLAYIYYPALVENIIRETHKKIYTDND